MSAPALVAPPIRVCLEDAYSRIAGGRNDPPPAIEKQWYLYWSGIANRLNGLVGYGPSDQRPDASSVADGGLYMQLDPGYVIYQSIQGEWHYVAGTMYGTLNPDQRPLGLGPNDAGFDFRAIDTDPEYSGREYIWSGSVWVETTPARYNTHAERLAMVPAQTVSGMLWAETDRSGVIYQLQAGAWHFLAGTMWGTLSPDQRPTDLGVNDAGFTFRGTDVARSFIWSGSAWIETTPPLAGDVQHANSSGNLALTTAPVAIPGAALTLNRAGRYLVTGNFTFNMTLDAGFGLRGRLFVGGADQGNEVLVTAFNNAQYMGTSQQWVYVAGAAGIGIELRALKDGGTGTSNTVAPATSITALWVSS